MTWSDLWQTAVFAFILLIWWAIATADGDNTKSEKEAMLTSIIAGVGIIMITIVYITAMYFNNR